MKKETKEKYVKVCPRCGSTDVHTDFSNPVVWAYGTPVKYQCKSCGLVSSIFPELAGKEKIQFQKKTRQDKDRLKNEPVVDVKTGYTTGLAEILILSMAAAFMFFIKIPLVGILFVVIVLVIIYRRKNKK